MKWRSLQRVAGVGKVEQERGGNIVGQVAHNSERRGQRREIEAQRIGLVHRQAPGGVSLAQAFAQVPVELDDVKVPDAARAAEQSAPPARGRFRRYGLRAVDRWRKTMRAIVSDRRESG